MLLDTAVQGAFIIILTNKLRYAKDITLLPEKALKNGKLFFF